MVENLSFPIGYSWRGIPIVKHSRLQVLVYESVVTSRTEALWIILAGSLIVRQNHCLRFFETTPQSFSFQGHFAINIPSISPFPTIPKKPWNGAWTQPNRQVPSFLEDSQLPRSDVVSQNVSSLRRAASVPVIRRNRRGLRPSGGSPNSWWVGSRKSHEKRDENWG